MISALTHDAGGNSQRKHCTASTHDAGGIPACSRWLSGAIPPENHAYITRTPAGVPAIHHHALDPHIAPLSSRVCHETPGTAPGRRMEAAAPRISRRRGSRLGRHTSGNRWRRGSCASSSRPQTLALPLRLHARIEKGIIDLDHRDHPASWLSLAGRLRSLHRQRIGEIRRATLHHQTRRTSPPTNIPRGIHPHAPKIRYRIRRTISRLTQWWTDRAGTPAGVRMITESSFAVVSLRSTTHPVVSLRSTTGYKLSPLPGCGLRGASFPVPVVSLVPRSTTGYKLTSLRDGLHILQPGGLTACSRGLRPKADTPGCTPHTMHPGGVPALWHRHQSTRRAAR